jgi:hypothetical protein
MTAFCLRDNGPHHKLSMANPMPQIHHDIKGFCSNPLGYGAGATFAVPSPTPKVDVYFRCATANKARMTTLLLGEPVLLAPRRGRPKAQAWTVNFL